MKYHRSALVHTVMVLLGAFAAGCGSSSDTPAATPTKTVVATATRTATLQPTTTGTPAPTALISATVSPTRTSTATVLPTQAAATVNGLLVVSRSITASASDALGAPPAAWSGKADTTSFNQSLAFASWSIVESPDKQGTTSPDGRFTVSGLAPGRYTLQVTKTLDGNLLATPGQSVLLIPFTVGSDGNASIIAQVTWGLVRSISTYTDGASQVREVHSPYGNWVITRDGRVSAFGDPGRTFVDDNGDGRFTAEPCIEQVWECGPDRSCGTDRVCACTASCPFCDDCGPGVCVPAGKANAYRCNTDGGCTLPGDKCVCVSSCPGCDDCGRSVCVPGCADVQITALTITSGPSQLVVGRQGQAYAAATLSDGSQFDVTYLADWQSSDDTVATVDSWGTVSALAVGNATLTATIGALTSAPFAVEVVERPTLPQIIIQNQSCACGPIFLGGPQADAAVRPCVLDVPARTDILPIPWCKQVVQVGSTLQFSALGQYADGSYEDLTKTVQWQIVPAEVGEIVDGSFTARVAGTGNITASLGTVVSDATEVRVVTEPTVVSLSIYADNGVYAVAGGGPVAGGMAVPCAVGAPGADLCCCPSPVDAPGVACGCGFSISVLRGDQLQFHATAQYDTGDWRDVTAQATWRSSNSATATIDATGVMTAVAAGDSTVDATFASVTSNPVGVRAVDHATLQSLSIYQEGTDHVVAKGAQAFFHATGYYDVGFSREVTKEVTWRSSDGSVGGFDTPGAFTGRAAGSVQIWAELDGQESNSVSLEVFETSELNYCDPLNVNRAVWSDNYNRVILESDCAAYHQPDVLALRYTVTEIQPHGGIFDPCLDLYVYQGDTRIRTIRQEGCGDAFLPASAPGRDAEALKYQLRAFWDLKDDNGQAVAPATYTIYGRFYLYYDPVVRLDVTVLSHDGSLPTVTPTPTLPIQPMCLRGPHRGAACTSDGECPASICVATTQRCSYGTDDAAPCVSNGDCPGGYCGGAPTQTPGPVCTPPLCGPGESFFCPDNCPGGCGTQCATPLPTVPMPSPPPIEGACFRGPEQCIGASFPTSQEHCCDVLRLSGSLLPITWCPQDALDPMGQCHLCGNPCAGLQTPTPTPCDPGPPCPGGQVKICDPTRCDDATTCVCELVPPTPAPSVTPTPVPTSPDSESGICYEQVNCEPLPYATQMSQGSCCRLARSSTGLPFSWCSSLAIDPMTGLCTQCLPHPCIGIPTPTLVP